MIPNVRWRPEDEEEWEGAWPEYVRRDLEGADAATRRRAAADFVRTLVDRFPQVQTCRTGDPAWCSLRARA